MDQIPLLNNRYQLLEERGKGGMAFVYHARDLMLERDVAIKVLREDYSSDPVFQERFRQEARAAANLSHPNIVIVHDFGLDQGKLFIVMEYIPGKDLKTLIQERGRFTPDEALPLLTQACAGIGYAHRAGLVHCDVKPQNILVMPDQRLKVTDFGIARALASIQPEEQADIVWGSPQYFAPEQAAGLAPSPASDVYALGVILYEMLTGSLPFSADTATGLAQLHIEATPPLLSEILPNISPALEQIMTKVLSKEPAMRYRTADQLGRVLLNFGSNRAKTTPALALTSEIQAEKYVSQPEEPVEEDVSLDIDWVSVGLGFLALLMVGGLVPFWVWVYFVYNPPIR
jgi:serine/threonine protein kinase